MFILLYVPQKMMLSVDSNILWISYKFHRQRLFVVLEFVYNSDMWKALEDSSEYQVPRTTQQVTISLFQYYMNKNHYKIIRNSQKVLKLTSNQTPNKRSPIIVTTWLTYKQRSGTRFELNHSDIVSIVNITHCIRKLFRT